QNGMNRFATRDQSLVYGVFTHSEAQEYERAWLESMLDSSVLSEEQIQALLHAEVDSVYAQGRMVCSCYKVGEKEIIRAIQDDGCDSVEALGSQLKCGTNCGSCKSELKQILKQNLVPEGERITLEEFS
ncbi:bacterioferritin-associated ferredoxin, partial [Oleiphilus sp. HI0066]|uniref:(2Fe-2S)-binding protein n=9 Tax=Oleiphilus TaxID=141450 RepID=UPI000A833ECA